MNFLGPSFEKFQAEPLELLGHRQLRHLRALWPVPLMTLDVKAVHS